MGRRGPPVRRKKFALSDEEIFGQLEKTAEPAPAFLWRYPQHQVNRLMERAGIMSRLQEMDYHSFHLTSQVEEGLHLLKLVTDDIPAPLIDLRLSEESRIAEGVLKNQLGMEPLAFLVIQWVSLQHVRAAFSMHRPPLPGQSYPGLGLGRKLYKMLWRMARELGKDVLSAHPLYYHNAIFYLAGFSYAEPYQQGQILAMRRDLAEIPLDKTSLLIHRGHLCERHTGHRVTWNPGEMVAPVSHRLSVYLKSPEYLAEVERVSSSLSFHTAEP